VFTDSHALCRGRQPISLDSAHYCLKNPYLFDAEKICDLCENTASSFRVYSILKTRLLIILISHRWNNIN